MKTFLILFLTFITSLQAEVHSMLIEPLKEGGYSVEVKGILSEGKSSFFYLKETSDKKKFTDIENAELFNFNRQTTRCYVTFYVGDVVDSRFGDLLFKDGTISRIEFHMETPFQSKIWNGGSLPKGLESSILNLKTQIENQ